MIKRLVAPIHALLLACCESRCATRGRFPRDAQRVLPQQQSGLRAFFIVSLFRGGGVKVTVTSRKVEPEERREPSSDLCIGKRTLPLLAIFLFAPCAHRCLSLYSAVSGECRLQQFSALDPSV